MPHHVIQRGNRRQQVFFKREDREFYLELLSKYTRKFGVYLLSYCLMDNHLHLLLVPPDKTALHRVMKPLHSQFAWMINRRMEWTGHLWQQRYYSSPVNSDYFWIALRYIERNPVEAGIVEHAANYRWSSAAAHCGLSKDTILYYSNQWHVEFKHIEDWHNWLSKPENQEKVSRLKANTRRDFPSGSKEFIRRIESELGRQASPRKAGRPKKTTSASESLINRNRP